MRIATFVPDQDAETSFYAQFVKFMQLAATQLAVELEVYNCSQDRELMVSQCNDLCTSSSPPDYMLVNNSRGVAKLLVERATEAGIKCYVVCEGMMFSQRNAVGLPRSGNPHWLGEYLPDDCEAGQVLAATLLQRACDGALYAGDGKVHVGGLGADLSNASLLRVNGLRTEVQQRDAVLHLVSVGGWTQQQGQEWMKILLDKDPSISVVWAASDAIAIGALDAVKAAGRAPGNDLLIGGIDWTPTALGLVQEGALATSIGGHILDGAWAVVLLHDHYHGRDFPKAMSSSWQAATQETASTLLKLYDERLLRRADFTRFSLVKNKSLSEHAFSVEELLSPA